MYFLIVGLLSISLVEETSAQDFRLLEQATNLTGLVWGKERAGYSISISTAKAKYNAGEPIDVKTLVKNVGTNQIFLGSADAIRDYDLVVMATNEIIFPTARGKKMIRDSASGSATGNGLKPGQAEPSYGHYPLTEIYDLRKPGKYRIYATRKLYDHQSNEWVKVISNTIEVIVEDARPKK